MILHGNIPDSDYNVGARGQKRLQSALRDMLKRYHFTHFITLTTNHHVRSPEIMRSLLREWDARVNRAINGPKWSKRPDERLVWFGFIEKIDVNPHWHLVAEVDPMAETSDRRRRIEDMPFYAQTAWARLVPFGSFDCQKVDSKRVNHYVTKQCSIDRSYERFVMPFEFM